MPAYITMVQLSFGKDCVAFIASEDEGDRDERVMAFLTAHNLVPADTDYGEFMGSDRTLPKHYEDFDGLLIWPSDGLVKIHKRGEEREEAIARKLKEGRRVVVSHPKHTHSRHLRGFEGHVDRVYGDGVAVLDEDNQVFIVDFDEIESVFD